MQNIVPVVKAALQIANCQLSIIDAIAFTQSPGLIGSLLVGSQFAKSIALSLNKPLITITVFAAFTFVPVYGVLVATHAIPSNFFTAPVGDILFQMIFQGCGSVVISGITFTKMIQYFGPVRSTMFTAIVPGSSALGAVYFLGEPLTWNLWAGLALVTCGILFGVGKVKANFANSAQIVANPLRAKG